MNAMIRAYSDMERNKVLFSESPTGLIHMLCEGVAKRCREAAIAIRIGNDEAKIVASQKAMKIIGDGLLGNLRERNGNSEMVSTLSDFYLLEMGRIAKANGDSDGTIFESVAKDFSEVAEAWREIDK